MTALTHGELVSTICNLNICEVDRNLQNSCHANYVFEQVWGNFQTRDISTPSIKIPRHVYKQIPKHVQQIPRHVQQIPRHVQQIPTANSKVQAQILITNFAVLICSITTTVILRVRVPNPKLKPCHKRISSRIYLYRYLATPLHTTGRDVPSPVRWYSWRREKARSTN